MIKTQTLTGETINVRKLYNRHLLTVHTSVENSPISPVENAKKCKREDRVSTYLKSNVSAWSVRLVKDYADKLLSF